MNSSDRIEFGSGALQAAPQVIILLDENCRILSVNRRLAGSCFPDLSSGNRAELHRQWHSKCDGECEFNEYWEQAWQQLEALENIEWEVHDAVLNRLIRMNLAKPPNARQSGPERRRRRALLTITDITAHRREHEELRARQLALEDMLLNQAESIDTGGALASSEGINRFGHNVILAQEIERKRIAAELHDSVAQSLGVVKFNIEAQLNALNNGGHAERAAGLKPVVEQIRALIDEVRRISRNLSPATLQDFGLCAAMDALCSQVQSDGLLVAYKCDAGVREMPVPEAIEIAVYRVAQEALNNVAKHADADNACVSLSTIGQGLELLIDDDGVGIPSELDSNSGNGHSGLGLRSMEERVKTTGGEFSLDSAPGDGTAIRAYWPRASLNLLRD